MPAGLWGPIPERQHGEQCWPWLHDSKTCRLPALSPVDLQVEDREITSGQLPFSPSLASMVSRQVRLWCGQATNSAAGSFSCEGFFTDAANNGCKVESELTFGSSSARSLQNSPGHSGGWLSGPLPEGM